MCDDFTLAGTGTDRPAAKAGLTRREFAALGGAAALAACADGAQGTEPSQPLAENMVNIVTGEGSADAFFVRPTTGRHPGVVLWPDIAGLREVKKIMARRLAAEGYAVLAVNQYYRSAPAPVVQSLSEWRTPEGQARLAPMIARITPEGTRRDAAAFVAFLDAEKAVDTARPIGTSGYCMGGPFAVRTAAALPARVGAVASFHGAALVTGAPDSPDRILAQTKAAFLFAIGRNDDTRQPEAKGALKAAAQAAGRPAEIEVYPADHGWCVPDSPAYDPVEADRAWARLLTLFKAL